MTKLAWWIIGIALTAMLAVFGWLSMDLAKRDREITHLRAETERLGAETVRVSVDRDVALAKCKVLEVALANAKRRETVTATTGKVTTVTVSPAGGTVTRTEEPSVTETEIVSLPSIPSSEFIDHAAPAGALPATANTPNNTLPSMASQRVASRVFYNTVSVGYSLEGTWTALYQRGVFADRVQLGVGANSRRSILFTTGVRF